MISVVNRLFQIIIIVCSLLLAGCLRNEPQKVDVQELRGEVFGSYYIVKYRGDLNKDNYLKALHYFFKKFNEEFSTYRSDSLISTFNQSPENTPLKVTPRFIEMLEFAEDLYQKTQGAFDPTLGPVIKLWGFGGGKVKRTPSDQELKLAMSKMGFHKVKWDKEKLTVWKTDEGVELDVNSFVPGWAADIMGQMLIERNIQNFMIDISGEILFKGKKSQNTSWVAGIEKPSQKHAQGVHVAFKIKDEAISTSGDYRQFFDEQGQRRSHIIDPRTGRPVEHLVSSASVITKTALEADAWSTAMMVLGPEGLKKYAKDDMKVLLLLAKKPGVYEELVSQKMKRFIEAHSL